ncbi:hypothetical protein [Nocardia iowensis]|uniref:Uncharacterized protein n=1 Tax=Nocardia iowensis TaxID=204891 RepID=A0ABX8RVH5_NOCIO|nr:hypothetical protein [Nocardia iowensis]QXN93659.1 hypothetical protein KV110_11615 [Nocardia iowensis]
MSDPTYRHSRILVRTDRRACCRSRPEQAPSLPAMAKRWWRTHLRAPEHSAAAALWQHALFFAPDAAGTGSHPAARQCLDWKETY